MHLEGCKSSGLKTADGAIVARPCLLHAVTIIPAAAASSALLYDNASDASGTELVKAQAVANGESVHHTFPHPVECLNGIFLDITGASAAAVIYYSVM